MQIQRGLQKDSTLTKFVLGAHPIIEHFVEKMRIREIMSTYMRTDKRMKLEDDKVLTLLIHNILTTSNALYEMEDWLKPLDAEKLGLSPKETKFIQDDKIGTGLFRFYNSRHKDVFFRLALRVIKVFELDCSRIHHDTTTVTFAGKYPHLERPGAACPWEEQRPSPRLETIGLGAQRHGRRCGANFAPDLRWQSDR